MTDAALRYLVEANDRDLKELQRSVRSVNRSLGEAEIAGGRAGRGMAVLSKAGAGGSKVLHAIGTAAKYAVLGLGVTAGVGLAAVLKTGTGELAEHAKVAAQTNAVLQSTGGVAGVTAGHVDELANSLLRKTGVDDEQVQSVENLLLGYTNIRNEVGKGNDVFDQATAIILDYSARTGKDAVASTKAFARALDDPVKGITALTRYGVSFTEAEKERIKTMVEAGKTTEAQGVIMDKLKEKFGGAAEAAGKTLPGQIERLKQEWANLAGELTERLVPAFTAVVDWVTLHWPEIEATFRAVFDGLSWAWSNVLQPALDGIVTGVKYVVDWVRTNWPDIKRITLETIDRITDGINRFVAFVKGIWADWGDEITAIAKHTWEQIKGTVQGALKVIQGIIDVVMGLIHGDWSRVWKGIREIFEGAWQLILTKAKGILNSLQDTVGLAVQAIKQEVTIGLSVLAAIATRAFGALVAAVRGALGEAKAAALAVGTAIKDAVVNGLTGLTLGVLAKFQALWAWIQGAASSAYTFALDIGRRLIQGVIDGITSKLGALKDAAGGIASKLVSWKGPPEADSVLLKDNGGRIIQGLIDGMTGKLPALQGAAYAQSQAILHAWTLSAQGIPQNLEQMVTSALVAAGHKAGDETDKLARTVTDRLQKLVDGARDKLDRLRSTFSSAFSTLSTDVLSAFDAQASKTLTESEQKLAALDKAEAAKRIAQGITDARDRIAEAQAALQAFDASTPAEGETDEERAAKRAQLVKDATDAQGQLDAALLEQERAGLEARAAQERLELDARNALRRRHLEEALGDLQESLGKQGAAHDKAQQDVLKLLRSYGVTYKSSGKTLGSSFAQGLRESESEVVAAAQAIAAAAAANLRLGSPAKEGPLASLDQWWEPFAPTLLAGLDRGRVTADLEATAAQPTGARRDASPVDERPLAGPLVGTMNVYQEADAENVIARISAGLAVRR